MNLPLPLGEGRGEGKGISLKEEFLNADIKEINGEYRQSSKVNYFKGDRPNWKTNIPTYETVNLGEIYKGIELKLKAYGNNVEKLFYVQPDTNPDKIKIKLTGAEGLNVNENGELEVNTELGIIKFTKPVAYQEEKIPSPLAGEASHLSPLPLGEGRGEGRKYIEVAYILTSTSTYSFKLGDYDKTKELVIDPLLASTFLGRGGYYDSGNSIAIDQSGNVFIVGNTMSLDFPTTPGVYDTSLNDYQIYNPFESGDVFISKLNSDLTQLLASTFLGGGYPDGSSSIAIDQSGSVYVTGTTRSPDFPTTPGAYDPTHYAVWTRDGTWYGSDVFVSKLSNDLTQLLASTFIGEGGDEDASSLAIDYSGNVFVAGTGASDFPTTPGAYATSPDSGWGDAFVSKLNSDLTQLLASTFVGIGGQDFARSLALDQSGNIYVRVAAGGEYILKLNDNLSTLLASTTIIGGGRGLGVDGGPSIAIDPSGNVYATGIGGADFITTPGTYDTTFNEGDIVILKWNSDLTQILASTFIGAIGGNWWDDSVGNSITIDSSGSVYVTGYTNSSYFPVTSGSYSGGRTDAFVLRLSSDLKQLLASTFIGGADTDVGTAVAIDQSGNVYVEGWTFSPDFPTTPGAYDTTYNGNYDIFISKFNFGTLPSLPSQSQGQGSGTNNQGTSNAPGLKNAPGLQKK